MAGLALAWLLGVPEITGGRRRADACRAPPARQRGAVAGALDRGAGPSARVVPVIVLSERDVRELLDMESCIEAMTEVLASLARGELFNPLRSIARPPGADTLLGLMPAYRAGASPAYALKEIVIVADQPVEGARHAHGRRAPPRRRDGRAARDHERVADHRDPHGRGVGGRDPRARAAGRPACRDPRRRRAGTRSRARDARRS